MLKKEYSQQTTRTELNSVWHCLQTKDSENSQKIHMRNGTCKSGTIARLNAIKTGAIREYKQMVPDLKRTSQAYDKHSSCSYSTASERFLGPNESDKRMGSSKKGRLSWLHWTVAATMICRRMAFCRLHPDRDKRPLIALRERLFLKRGLEHVDKHTWVIVAR